MKRREFLKTTAWAASAAGLTSSGLGEAAGNPTKVQLGVTPNSWGVWFPQDPLQLPWQRFLDEVVASGYKAIELGPYGYLPVRADILRAELSRRGLGIVAGHVRGHLELPSRWPRLQKQVEQVGELVAAQGGEYLVLIDDTYTGYFTGPPVSPRRLDDPAWKQLIETTSKVADLVQKQFDLRVAFHPYADSHVESADEIEGLLQQTDPKRVLLCMDTGHFAFSGIDPAAFLRRHHSRVAFLHLQDVDGSVRKNVAEVGDVMYVNAVGRGLFCEPGKGLVNFPALRDVLKEVDFAGWAMVEQEMYPTAYDRPLPIAQRSRAYFQEIFR